MQSKKRAKLQSGKLSRIQNLLCDGCSVTNMQLPRTEAPPDESGEYFPQKIFKILKVQKFWSAARESESETLKQYARGEADSRPPP